MNTAGDCNTLYEVYSFATYNIMAEGRHISKPALAYCNQALSAFFLERIRLFIWTNEINSNNIITTGNSQTVEKDSSRNVSSSGLRKIELISRTAIAAENITISIIILLLSLKRSSLSSCCLKVACMVSSVLHLPH